MFDEISRSCSAVIQLTVRGSCQVNGHHYEPLTQGREGGRKL